MRIEGQISGTYILHVQETSEATEILQAVFLWKKQIKMLPRSYQHQHLDSATLAVYLGYFCCPELNMCISNCILPLIHCFLSLSQSPVPSFLQILIFYSFSKISLSFTMKVFQITPEKLFVPLLNAIMTQLGPICIAFLLPLSAWR